MNILNLVKEYKNDIDTANKNGFNKKSLLSYEKGSIRNCEAFALYSIIRNFKCKNILDVGTGKGFSALIFAKALCDENVYGIVDTIDINQNFDENLFENFDLESFVNFHQDNSGNIIPKLDKNYDFALIDGEHSYNQTKIDFINIFDKIKKNGFVAFHDAYPRPDKNGVISVIEEIKEENIGEFIFFNEKLFDYFSYEEDINDMKRMKSKWKSHNYSYVSKEANPKELMAVFIKRKENLQLSPPKQKIENIEDEDFLKEWLN